MQLVKDYIKLLPLFFIGCLLVFNRPFVGLNVFGFRIGEILVGLGFLFSLLLFFIFVLNNNKYIKNLPYSSVAIYCLIIFSFFISLYMNDTQIARTYTYRISSYIWTTGYFFIGHYLFSNHDIFRKYKWWIVATFMFVPIAHYFMSTGYYPNYIIKFFNIYSDKFEFTKASDIFLSYVVANIFLYKLITSKYFKFSYLLATSALLFPLLLLMSRGAFIGSFIFFLISIYYFRFFMIQNLKKTIIMILISAGILLLSIFNVNEIDFGFNINFSGDIILQPSQIAGEDLSISNNILKIVRKGEQRKAFLSLYFENGRLYSIDQTTNWRFDIWQDTFEDMLNKNIFLRGYGYNEILPIMTDPTAPGRLGRDGLNEHVHNYFVNIIARGGISQFILFLFFHISILLYWKKSYLNNNVLVFVFPILITSTFDMNMEGVQFPIIFYSIYAYLITTQQKSKLIHK